MLRAAGRGVFFRFGGGFVRPPLCVISNEMPIGFTFGECSGFNHFVCSLYALSECKRAIVAAGCESFPKIIDASYEPRRDIHDPADNTRDGAMDLLVESPYGLIGETIRERLKRFSDCPHLAVKIGHCFAFFFSLYIFNFKPSFP